MHHIGFIGNVVGSLKVGIVGNRSAVDKASLVKAITGIIGATKNFLGPASPVAGRHYATIRFFDPLGSQ